MRGSKRSMDCPATIATSGSSPATCKRKPTQPEGSIQLMSIFARIGTIVGKLGLIADSNLNTVLDRVIDFNSTGAIETYIRELKDSSMQLDQAVAETIGR